MITEVLSGDKSNAQFVDSLKDLQLQMDEEGLQ